MTRIPDGTYPSEITAARADVSKEKGNPMLVVDVNVMANGVARPRTTYLVVTGKGAGGFDGLLRACGFVQQADAFKRGDAVPFDETSLVGLRPNVVIKAEEYNGELRDKIARFVPASSQPSA